jgi:hypothetical protein
MTTAQLIGATNQIFDQDPMRLLVAPCRVGIIDLGDTGCQLTVVMLEAGVHVSGLAGFAAL